MTPQQRGAKGEVALQREYYAKTAGAYDEMHMAADAEHEFALAFMTAVLEQFDVRSVVDIGSGTGRVLRHLKEVKPEIRLVGVEPVAELRNVGYGSGLGHDELVDGDATALPFADEEFDLCCAFGVLHHVREPAKVVNEMLRVARKAIFISDSNNFGQGSRTSRFLKQMLNGAGLWKIADLIKTRGRGYSITPGDGLSYSYSVFSNYEQIARSCRVHVLNTAEAHVNPYRTAGHVALLGVKRD